MRQATLLAVLAVSGCVYSRHQSMTMSAEGAPPGVHQLRLAAAWAKVTHQERVRTTAVGEVATEITDLGPTDLDVYGAPGRRYRQVVVGVRVTGGDARYSLDLEVRRCSADGFAAWKDGWEGERPWERSEELRARVRNGCVDESPSPDDEKAFTDLRDQLRATLNATPITRRAAPNP